MGKGERISPRQLSVLIFVSLLAPMMRILPVSAVMLGGKAAWLSPLPALAAGLLVYFILGRLLKGAPEGAGLPGLAIRSLGRLGGRVFCLLLALWLTLYAGFLARTSAERMISAIFPLGEPWLLAAVILSVSLLAAWGSLRALARSAEIFMPLLLLVLSVVILSALWDIKPEYLLPVTYQDAQPILSGAIPTLDVMSLSVVFLCLRGDLDRRGQGRPFHVLPAIAACALAVTLVTLGSVSEAVCVRLQNAFFAVIRDVQVLGLVDRAESVVVAIWTVTDFTLLSALFIMVSKLCRAVFRSSRRQPFLLPAGAASAASCFFVAPNAFALLGWSRLLVPAVNMSVTLVLIPLVLVIGKLRRTI